MSRPKRPKSYYKAVYNSTTTKYANEGEEDGLPQQEDVNFKVLGIRRGPETVTFIRRASQRYTTAREKSAVFRERVLQVSPALCKRHFCKGLYFVIALTILFSLALLGIGIWKMKDCREQIWLPRYLVGAGSLGIVYAVPNLGFLIIRGRSAFPLFQGIMIILITCWLIVGTVFLGVSEWTHLLSGGCDSIVVYVSCGTVSISWILLILVLSMAVLCVLHINFRM